MNHADINPLKAIEYIYSNGAKYAQAKAELTYPVSYTHLTLPTIYSV